MAEGLNGELPGWFRRAACSEMPTDLFECDLRETARRRAAAEYQQRNAHAKRVCGGCPVRGDCLEWAMQRPDPLYGHVAGGLTHHERVQLRRARRAAG